MPHPTFTVCLLALWLPAMLTLAQTNAPAQQQQLPQQVAATVTVTGGQVLGAAMADGSTIFNGIPYAASPAGARRWLSPAPRAPWAGVLDATAPAPA